MWETGGKDDCKHKRLEIQGGGSLYIVWDRQYVETKCQPYFYECLDCGKLWHKLCYDPELDKWVVSEKYDKSKYI